MNGVMPVDDLQAVGVRSSVAASDPFFQRIDWWSFFITSVVVLTVYMFTLAPEVTLGDSGVLATGALYAGVGHPPGFPLWSIYAWLFTVVLPFSNIAWRVSVSSAVAGALACGVVAMMVSQSSPRIVESVVRLRRPHAKDEKWLRAVCGCVAGAGFGFCGTFWGDAVIVESQPLGILLFSLTLCLQLRWVYSLEAKHYLYAASFVYGLMLTVSLELSIALPGLLFIVLLREPSLGRDVAFTSSVAIFVALLAHRWGFLPMIVEGLTQFDSLQRIYLITGIFAALASLILILITRRILTEWRTVFVAWLTLLLGLSLYFYIAVASMTNPPMNWGYPRTVEGFIHAISRGQFERLHPTESFVVWLGQVGQYGKQTTQDVGLIYLLPALLPFCFIHKMLPRERGWMLGLFATFLCLSFFMVAMLNAPPDIAVMGMIKEFFPASYLILALWSGYGLVLLGTILGGRQARQ